MKQDNTKKKIELRHEFGRVISHPNRHNGAPFLNGTGITVEQVLNLLDKSGNDNEAIEKLDGLEQQHIEICRAYQARFLAHTQADLEHLDENDKFFMLDENVSYMLLHHVARRFGWSSHVFAEGLYDENNDDEAHIWAHMIENNYKAILTEDSDFRKIARQYRKKILETYGSVENCPTPVPVAIFISKSVSVSPQDTLALLEHHEQDIKQFVSDNNAAFAAITGNGFDLYYRDEELLKDIAKAKPRKNTDPSASPF
ncbi:MAG: DUF5615 family PIN-like protein [Rhodospirillales bacterium]|nr:DUF5615 family PIN-like protein [Rhodospirillales bacterium]MCB9995227.1 DUF5615 family PIN-like protein [Rhodospirillales bacterium]